MIERSTDDGSSWTEQGTTSNLETYAFDVGSDGFFRFRVRAVVDGVTSGASPPTDEILVTTEARVLRSNVRVTLSAANGRLFKRASVSWTTPDGALASSTPEVTDSNGTVEFPVLATGPVAFTFTDGFLGSPEHRVVSARAVAFVGRRGDVLAVAPRPRPLVERRVTARMPDGSPVPGAEIEVNYWLFSTGASSSFNPVRQEMYLTLRFSDWVESPRTNADGVATIVGYQAPLGPADIEVYPGFDATARFDDGLLTQSATAVLSDERPVFRFEQMPLVRVVSVPTEPLPPGDTTEVVVEAVDGVGDPISGSVVTFSQLGSGARDEARSGCSGRVVGTTNERGRVRFTVCPSSSSRWQADASSAVASRAVRIEVAARPEAPRGLAARRAGRSVILDWSVPRDVGGGRLIDYQVGYSVDGGATWTRYRDGRSTATEASLSTMPTRRFVVRVAAVTTVGRGPWAQTAVPSA